MARLVSMAILATLIVVIGITFYQVVAPFLLPLFLAGVAAILCQPLFRYFCWRTQGKLRLAAGLTTGAVLAAFLIPLLIGIFIGSVQLYELTQRRLSDRSLTDAIDWCYEKASDWELYQEAKALLATSDEEKSAVRDNIGGDDVEDEMSSTPTETQEESIEDEAVDGDSKRDAITGLSPADEESKTPVDATVPPSPTQMADNDTSDELTSTDLIGPNDASSRELPDEVRRLLQTVAERSLGMAGKTIDQTLNILGTIVSGLVGVMMFVIALYYFLADGPKLILATEQLIPVHITYQRALLKQFDTVIRAVVLATFLAAIAQGLATAVALYIVGFKHFFIISIAGTLAAMIPLAGTWLIWGPCAVWLAAHGYWGSFAFLFVVGAGVIGTMDNVIRTYVLQSDAKLHPLLAFVSVLGGLQVMGLWGVFFGPIAACCLHALVQIFNTELASFSKSKAANEGEADALGSVVTDVSVSSPPDAADGEDDDAPCEPSSVPAGSSSDATAPADTRDSMAGDAASKPTNDASSSPPDATSGDAEQAESPS